LKPHERILSVIAYRHDGTGETFDYKSAIDLTDTLTDGTVCFDIPEGVWRVCTTVETSYASSNKSDRFLYYIDMLNKDSCRAMIDAVYEPHYAHFAEYFGNTFRGFFSDEPGFLNVVGTYQNKPGMMFLPYPWREDLPALIAESAGLSEQAVRLAIPALWENLGEISSLIRMHYMEVVTKLYRENFSYLLGDWCRAHGVMYVGHVIEDMGAHQRLAYGSGHFFRALDGQDMAGIDIVLIQDIPGVLDGTHRASCCDGGIGDPAFFHYTLPKLASSHAHIQPLKQGRAMCEIFGAFGWAEGLPYMKGLADLMLASGVNHFVPHAFSPKEEDPDCPPHFYNGGKNVQYPLFGTLMDYMGRVSHLISGKKHKADVAVFYNAEAEWTDGSAPFFHPICRVLTQGLTDFDIVPFDVLSDAKARDGRLVVNGEDYGALIVSGCEKMPIDRLFCFTLLASQGLPILFTDKLPSASAEGEDISALLPSFTAVPTDGLVKELRTRGLCHVDGTGEGLSALRFYHVSGDGKEVYLFSNEAIRNDLDAVLTLRESGECLVYEPYANRLYRHATENGKLRLRLEKGNMLFVIFGEEIPEGTPCLTFEAARKALPLRFDVEIM
ncbi:MAG: glycosyl transferase family 2, partial [Clostridia bacterium]|nr:glycosyl transferase family 2 [Clostridia bacterium]